MPQRVNENGDPLRSEKSYIMMRGFGLILLRDIVEGYAREFKPFLTDVDEKHAMDIGKSMNHFDLQYEVQNKWNT